MIEIESLEKKTEIRYKFLKEHLKKFVKLHDLGMDEASISNAAELINKIYWNGIVPVIKEHLIDPESNIDHHKIICISSDLI